jgi:hypothetical protein
VSDESERTWKETVNYIVLGAKFGDFSAFLRAGYKKIHHP